MIRKRRHHYHDRPQLGQLIIQRDFHTTTALNIEAPQAKLKAIEDTRNVLNSFFTTAGEPVRVEIEEYPGDLCIRIQAVSSLEDLQDTPPDDPLTPFQERLIGMMESVTELLRPSASEPARPPAAPPDLRLPPGMIVCPRCKGTGVDPEPDQEASGGFVCRQCKGTGAVTQPANDGRHGPDCPCECCIAEATGQVPREVLNLYQKLDLAPGAPLRLQAARVYKLFGAGSTQTNELSRLLWLLHQYGLLRSPKGAA